jgi:hypothetical protein
MVGIFIINMKIIITESQYKMLVEQDKDILRISFNILNNDWDLVQKFLERRGNPPYIITDDLDLSNTDVTSLGNLVSVEGDLNLSHTPIESLGNLESVGDSLYLAGSKIESLGNLTSVGDYLDLYKSKIKSLGNLESVGGDLYLENSRIESLGNLQSVGGDLYLKKTPLSKKYTKEEIRSMVEVGGKIHY